MTLAPGDHDPVGDLAHLITGHIAANCCHRTGGYNLDPKCECRAIAEGLIENKARVLELLTLT
jgi:hypothetical protein